MMDDNRRADFICNILLLALFIYIVFSLFGCTHTRYIPASNKMTTIEKETLVPIPVPSDSLSITAWLECDERGRVVMKWLEEERSKNIRLQLSIDSLGKLKARIHTVHDTIYIPSREVIRTDSISIPVPVERKLGAWEYTCFYFGRFVIYALAAGVLFVFAYLLLRRKTC